MCGSLNPLCGTTVDPEVKTGIPEPVYEKVQPPCSEDCVREAGKFRGSCTISTLPVPSQCYMSVRHRDDESFAGWLRTVALERTEEAYDQRR